MNKVAGGRTIVITTAILLGVALLASATVAIAIGPASISPSDVFSTVLSHFGVGQSPLSPIRDGIVWEIRLPRVLTAAFVGAGLAVSGAVMQSLTRNPLADPYLLGLSSGASLGAVAVLIAGVAILLPVAAFVGALAALFLTLILAGSVGRITPTRTVLAGIAVSSLAGAITSLVIFWTATGDSFREILSWLLGSLAGSDWSTVQISSVGFAVAGTALLVCSRVLDAFDLGDERAAALGVRVGAWRWSLLVTTALLTGTMVSVSGAIGFVGLILPHAVRFITGPAHRNLLPVVALVGAIYLLWADTIARTAFDPRELPVGIVTAIVGAPAFALLLMRRRGLS